MLGRLAARRGVLTILGGSTRLHHPARTLSVRCRSTALKNAFPFPDYPKPRRSQGAREAKGDNNGVSAGRMARSRLIAEPVATLRRADGVAAQRHPWGCCAWGPCRPRVQWTRALGGCLMVLPSQRARTDHLPDCGRAARATVRAWPGARSRLRDPPNVDVSWPRQRGLGTAAFCFPQLRVLPFPHGLEDCEEPPQ